VSELDAEIRRLRSRVATLEDDKRVLEERLAFAWQEVNRIRAKLLSISLNPATGGALGVKGSVLRLDGLPLAG
jgi:hypothetical protein